MCPACVYTRRHQTAPHPQAPLRLGDLVHLRNLPARAMPAAMPMQASAYTEAHAADAPGLDVKEVPARLLPAASVWGRADWILAASKEIALHVAEAEVALLVGVASVRCVRAMTVPAHPIAAAEKAQLDRNLVRGLLLAASIGGTADRENAVGQKAALPVAQMKELLLVVLAISDGGFVSGGLAPHGMLRPPKVLAHAII
mmetsp:Transcript_76002/g.154252  ORF Transcript_76002/g.154252 Transcript_76002/m.154252 type:complete len:200 (-) Transcript_76002:441-1040(-)